MPMSVVADEIVAIHVQSSPPPPPKVREDNGVSSIVDKSEAMAVANTMPHLQHLELAYVCFSEFELKAVVTMCTGTSVLDIRGCWNVKLAGDVKGKCDLIQMFKHPWYDQYDYYDESVSGNDAAGNDNSDHDFAAAVDAAEAGGGGRVGGYELVVISDDDDDNLFDPNDASEDDSWRQFKQDCSHFNVFRHFGLDYLWKIFGL